MVTSSDTMYTCIIEVLGRSSFFCYSLVTSNLYSVIKSWRHDRISNGIIVS
uniref:Uncharacterized protein n=1 Tax=Onchocerca volvulus TaxID=6282 RepID=A0A8R1XU29_ONCVO